MLAVFVAADVFGDDSRRRFVFRCERSVFVSRSLLVGKFFALSRAAFQCVCRAQCEHKKTLNSDVEWVSGVRNECGHSLIHRIDGYTDAPLHAQ